MKLLRTGVAFTLFDFKSHFLFTKTKVAPSEMSIYRKTEKKCRNLTKFISIGYLLDAATLFTAAVIYSFYCMWSGNFDTTTWLLPYNLYLPFDTSTIYLWYVLWLMQCYIGLVYSLSVTCVTTYFESCCLYIVALCEHSNALIQSFSLSIEWYRKSQRIEMNKQSVKEQKLQLNKIIELHIMIYE